MLTKINVFGIVKEHLKTLRKYGKKRMSISDAFTFIIIPLVCASYLLYKNLSLTEGTINTIIAALSIFAGFLFNLLAIVFGLMDKIKINAEGDELKEKLVKEVHSNISYNILLSVLTILMLFLCLYKFKGQFDIDFKESSFSLKYASVVNFATYFLLVNFLFTLLMVIKRVHILMKKEF